MVTIIVRGSLVHVLLEISPELCKPYIRKDKKGDNIFILKFLNAIYGTMVASLM